MSPEPRNLAPTAIRRRVKELIADVASLDPEEIADGARLVEDLELDSLSVLEIGVDVDYEFKLGVSEERLKELRSVQDFVEQVQRVLGERAALDGAA